MSTSTTTTTVPSHFKALRTQNGPTIKVDTIARDPKGLGPDHVFVKTLAVGLNPTDWKHAVGPWNPRGDHTYVTGCDFAGLVVEAGANVKHIKVGNRIAGFAHGCYNEHNGAYAEYVQCHKALAFVIPEGMSSVEAAAFPIPHLTAFQALFLRLALPTPSKSSASAGTEDSQNKPTLLIWGGATAVGFHLIQLAKLSGCNTIVTASPDNHASLKSLGANECFDYKDKDVLAKIKQAGNALAGDKGITAAIDTVVERGSVENCIDAISSAGGRVITLLPASDEQTSRRSDVKVELTLGYTLQGYALTFANELDLPAMPEDNAASLKWVSEEMPLLLEGWSSENGGSPTYRGQKLRVLAGGLESVHEGLEIMRAGNYRAEKLVYSFEGQ